MESRRNGDSVRDRQAYIRQSNELIYEVVLLLLACDGKLLNGYSNGRLEPKLHCQGSDKIFKALLGACKEFLLLHDKELKASVDKLDMSDLNVCDTFHETIHKIFVTGINWGRVVSAICVTKTMAHRAMSENRIELTESIVRWLQTMVVDELHDWISENGGWARFPDKFNPDRKVKEDKVGNSSWLTLAAAGVGFLVVASILGR